MNASDVHAPRTVAVIGASSAPGKYGNKAVRAYLRRGWTVYPVNPTESALGGLIEGLRVYPSIAAIPGPVERATLYLPPHVGVGVLEAIKAKGVQELYVNPGAESDELFAQAERLGLEAIFACSIVEIGERP